MILTSKLLRGVSNVRHGFSTRLGGVSSGPYRTLNLGRDVDEPDNVSENRKRFCASLGVHQPRDLIQIDQVHGTLIWDADDALGQEGDGIISASLKAVGVRTADCAPILMVGLDEDHQAAAVAAVHAGWRGATAGILREAIDAFGSRGIPAQRLRIAIGPTIGLQHFEVGPEVVAAAQRSLGGEPPKKIKGPRGRPHLDLTSLLKRQALQGGLEPAQVDVPGWCTFENRAMFYSHRRDHGVTGRLLSAIRLTALPKSAKP